MGTPTIALFFKLRQRLIATAEMLRVEYRGDAYARTLPWLNPLPRTKAVVLRAWLIVVSLAFAFAPRIES